MCPQLFLLRCANGTAWHGDPTSRPGSQRYDTTSDGVRHVRKRGDEQKLASIFCIRTAALRVHWRPSSASSLPSCGQLLTPMRLDLERGGRSKGGVQLRGKSMIRLTGNVFPISRRHPPGTASRSYRRGLEMT